MEVHNRAVSTSGFEDVTAHRAPGKADERPCTLARGPEADGLLCNPGFLQSWSSLRHGCPWATAFQSPDFIVTWYRIYRDDYEPVLVCQHAADGQLVGLLTLAVSRRGDDWRLAGAESAEYQTWLAGPDRGEAFIGQALTLAIESCDIDRLHCLYLPSAVPLGWIGSATWRDRVRVEEWRRPLMAVADADAFTRSLAKKSNKSRLNRLKRLGELRLEAVTDRARLTEVIDRFADLCDVRHGAAHRVLPFRADPRKAGFHLALIERPGLLDVSLLWAGTRLVAAHMGLRDGPVLYNGMITHSPFEARHSPGKLHVLLLARWLAEQGMRWFDLTPGNDPWKDRFATGSETVRELVIHRRALPARAETLRIRGKRFLGSMIRTAGWDPSRLREGLRELRRCRLADLASRVAAYQRYGLFTGSAGAVGLAPKPGDLRLNDLAHLANHAARRDDVRLSEFLARSLERLEQGQSFCSAVLDGDLAFLAWIQPAATHRPGRPPWDRVEIPERCALIEIEATGSTGPQRNCLGRWIGQTLHLALAGEGSDSVLVEASLDDFPGAQAIRSHGLTQIAEGRCFRLLGMTRAWVTPTPPQAFSSSTRQGLGRVEGAMAGNSGRVAER